MFGSNIRYSYAENMTMGFSGDVVLVDSQVDAKLNGVVAEVCITHEFINNELENIEAVYTFALPLDATLLSLAMELREKHYHAEVMPKAAGETRYEDAVTDGDSAVLLTEVEPGLFSMSVGNLQPGDKILISLNYAEVLRWQDAQLRFYFPTTIGQRFGDMAMAGLLPHQQIAHELDTGLSLGFSLRVYGELAKGIAQSPSHRLSTQFTDDSDLLIKGDNLSADRDIIVTLQAPTGYLGEVLMERSHFGEQFAAHFFAPQFKAQQTAGCYQFVVDCSGSMGGDSINQARKALHAISKILQLGDYFNLVRFGSDAHSLFRQPMAVDDRSLTKLGDCLSELQADLGGTEIAKALQLARTTGLHSGLSTNILLITDGEVWDTEAIIAESTKAAMRVFTVGVGSAVNQPLLERLSRATGATATFVSPNESMAEAIVAHFKRCRGVPFASVSVGWPDALQQQRNEQLWYAGDSVSLYAQAKEDVRLSANTLRATITSAARQDATDELQFELPIRHYQGLMDGTLARLAAKARLDHEHDPLALALEYQLLCQHTSCVLVAEREVKALELPKLRTVKQMLPAGEHGFGTVVCSSMPMLGCGPLDEVYSSLDDCLIDLSKASLFELNYPLEWEADTKLLTLHDIDSVVDRLCDAIMEDELYLSLECLKDLGIEIDTELQGFFVNEMDEEHGILALLLLVLEQSSDPRVVRPLRRWCRALQLEVKVTVSMLEQLRNVSPWRSTTVDHS